MSEAAPGTTSTEVPGRGSTASPARSGARRGRAGWPFLLVGISGAVVALAPWLITGGRMPLQNLWSELPSDIPFVLLPFHPYTATLVAAIILFGATIGGVAGRARGSRRVRGATLFLLLGAITVQGLAVAQSAVTTRSTLPDVDDADLYVIALTTGAVLTIGIAAGVIALVAKAPRAGAVMALSVGSVAAGPWLAALIVPFGTAPTEIPPLLTLVQWVPPVLAGAAVAWAGLGSAGRIVAALGAVLIVWIGPAVLTGVGYALGSRVMWNDPAGMIDGAIHVFGLALLTPELAWRPIVACVLTAAIGLGVRAVVVGRRSGRGSPGEELRRDA